MFEPNWITFFSFFLLSALPGLCLILASLPEIVYGYFHERQIIKSLRPKKYGNDADFDFIINSKGE